MSVPKIIIHLNDVEDGFLAYRAARYLVERPEQSDALLEYGESRRFYVKRNKASITVWQQTNLEQKP